jgi:FtsP/CotA-like multicopper oxidase with cupredoxin domain
MLPIPCTDGRYFNMRSILNLMFGGFIAIALLLGVTATASAQGHGCFRFPVGSTVTEPEDLFSQNGVLAVNLSYETSIDENGNQLFCYVLADGQQSPNLHVRPGDVLVLTLTNDTPAPTSSDAMRMQMSLSASDVCGATTMNASSTNVHFHGTNTPPVCHQDEVIHTLINSGQTFTYEVHFPSDEPPGMYWYHPHAHGLAEMAVLGGASGALIIDGIENLQPKVVGLIQRVLVVRDNLVPGNPQPGGSVPSKDLSLNFIPVPYPSYPPAVISMIGKREFWRVANTCADTVLDLQVRYDGKPQPLEIVALDGVPIDSQDGSRRGKIISKTHILLPTASRAEFIVEQPKERVKKAELVTLNINTGPVGDDDPTRPLARIQTATTAGSQSVQSSTSIPNPSGPPNPQRFEGLVQARPTTERTLYFSETQPTPSGGQTFFITVVGQTPVAFSPNNPPAITTTQGSVEDWTIQNRSQEIHEFHIHQTHFLLLEQNGKPVPPQQRQFLDMVNVPYWSGTGPYPSVKLRIDFRGPITGDFVYHCHILEYEDGGMMAIIRVLPPNSSSNRGEQEKVTTLPDQLPTSTRHEPAVSSGVTNDVAPGARGSVKTPG